MNNDKLISQINRKRKKDKFFFKFKVRKTKKLLTKTAIKLRSTTFLILKSEFNQSEENIFKILDILKENKVLNYKTLPEEEKYIEITFEGASEELPKYKAIEKKETPKIEEKEEIQEEKSLIREDLKTNNEEKVIEKNDLEEPIVFGKQYELADEDGSYEF